jgi:hypothetical protein
MNFEYVMFVFHGVLDLSCQGFENGEDSCEEAVPGEELIDPLMLKLVQVGIGGAHLA